MASSSGYFNMASQMVISKESGERLVFGELFNNNSQVNQLLFGLQHKNLGAIESIEIDESVKDMGDTCKVVIPRNLKSLQGKNVSTLLAPGDKVSVYFGYDDYIPLEFSGYIKEVSGTAPIELLLDDEFYPLRRNSITKSYKAVTLKQFLNDVAPGYKIECPGVNLGKTIVNKVTSYQALKQINETYGFYSYIKSGTLHTHFAYNVRGLGSEYTYFLCDEVLPSGQRIYRANIRPGGNRLKFQHKDTTNVRVEVCANRNTGKKFTYAVGPALKEASVHRLNLPVGITDTEAKNIAENLFAALNFDGYTGSITGYGTPRVKAGDSLNIIDFEYPERNGKYLVEKVRTRYDENGISRECTISFKI